MGVHYKDQAKQADSMSNDEGVFHSKQYYAITIKNVTTEGQYTHESDLYHQLQGLATKRRPIDIGHHVYELDSKNRLHIHAIISCKEFFCKQKKGWTIHSSLLRTAPEVRSWYDYMSKCAYNNCSQDQILQLNYLYNHNLFI